MARNRSITAGAMAAALLLATISSQCAWAVPVDEATLVERPALASVPVGPPSSTNTARLDFDTADVSAKRVSSVASAVHAADAAQRVAQAYETVPIEANAGFIKAEVVEGVGPSFVNDDDDSIFYPGGTTWYNLMQHEKFNETSITTQLALHYQNGVRLLRAFGHIDGEGTTVPVKTPIQPIPGVFNETALQRYDFVMDALAKAGIRVIITLTNYWPEFGGVDWYVSNLVGPSQPRELFYTDATVIAAYQAWLRTLATRVNTVSLQRLDE